MPKMNAIIIQSHLSFISEVSFPHILRQPVIPFLAPIRCLLSPEIRFIYQPLLFGKRFESKGLNSLDVGYILL